MKQEKHKIFMDICRRIGWKCTPQRLAVYDYLCGNRQHPNVDRVWHDIQKTIPSITRESVYRILNELSQHGVICRLDHIESARYDSRTQPHGHFICTKCGAISDFDLPEGVSLPAVDLPGDVHHVEFRAVGICATCLNEAPRKTPE